MKLTLPQEAPPNGQNDSLGIKEGRAFKDESDLKTEADNNQHLRRERVRDFVSFLLAIWVIVAGISLVVATAIWGIHLLGHQDFRWLSPQDISTVKETITNIAVGAIFGFLIKDKYM